MKLTGLSFDALPPIDLPFRFFISAPFFMLLCTGVIFISGESLWLSRWQPSMLALIHGFTLGFLTMVMMGTLLQLLPVIAGIGIIKPRVIAGFCHALLTLGTLSLMAGFMYFNALLIYSAMLLLALALGVYIAALIWVLSKKLSQGESIWGFRFAIFSLLIVTLLGLALLARNLGVEWIPATKMVTNIHALWGLTGWAGILIIAVSFQVIPMFHVAPAFPLWVRRLLIPAVFIALTFSMAFPRIGLTAVSALHAIFALVLLLVIHQRKRKVPDTSIRYWQLGALALLVSSLLFFVPETLWDRYLTVNKTHLLAALFLFFYLMSIIQGMLLKILPFLSYTHLQQRCLMNFDAMRHIPNMHDFLNKKHGQWLFYLHITSGFLLIMVLAWPSLYFAFAISLGLESIGLLMIMLKTMILYFAVNTKINQTEKYNTSK